MGWSASGGPGRAPRAEGKGVQGRRARLSRPTLEAARGRRRAGRGRETRLTLEMSRRSGRGQDQGSATYRESGRTAAEAWCRVGDAAYPEVANLPWRRVDGWRRAKARQLTL